MKKWKAIGIASILLGLSAILSNPAFATHVQLTHYTYSDHGDGFREYLSIIANRFETQTGISVEFVISSGGFDGYRSKLLTMVAGGVAPDVTDAHPVLAAPLLTKDLFEDLMPYVKRDKLSLEQRIPPVAIRGVTAPDGTLWGLPYSVYPVVTFFNADLFSEAGLPNPRELGERWTWETLTSSAKSLTRDKDGDGIMETIGTERISSRWEMQVHQAGGQLYDSIVYPNMSQFNSPEVLRAVEFIQGLYAENMAVTNAAYRTWKGNVGFNVVDGPTVIGLYYQDVPFSWDIAQQPKGPANRAARVNPGSLQVVAHSGQRDIAWQWVHFVTSLVDNQLELARVCGSMPASRDAMVRYARLGAIKLPDNWHALIDTASDPNGYPAYVVPQATQIDAAVNPVMSQIWAGRLAPAVGLEQIHKVVTGLLK